MLSHPYNVLPMQQQDVVESLRAKIREVPGFPKPDILFYDITTVLKDASAFRQAVDLMAAPFRDSGVDAVAAMESRGFIFGAPIAYLLDAEFVPIRKLGKLPAETITREYTLEYATTTLQMHADAISPGQRVLLVDDLLATGGTVSASLDMVKQLGGEPIAVVVLVELDDLGGRGRLEHYGVDVVSFIHF
jgi:adenine phosphoribosyltransferase